MGLLNSGMLGILPMLMQQQQPGMGAMSDTEAQQMRPQLPPNSSGMPGAFSGNPQFMQQLQAMQNQQSPGFQGAVMTPPQTQMSTTAPMQGAPGSGGRFGNPMNNYGMGTDPMQALMQRMGRGTY